MDRLRQELNITNEKNKQLTSENKILNEQLIGKEMSHEPAFGDTVFEILKQNNKQKKESKIFSKT